MYPSLVFLMISVWVGLMTSCSTTRPIALLPASSLEHDMFTCKGLSSDQHWVDITDEFIPAKDSKVVIVIQLAPEDAKKMINVEINNPYETVVFSENLKYPKEKVLGLAYEMDRLMANGGEGEWKAFVFADGLAIGRAVFYVGKKTEKKEEEGPRYFVVGGESTAADEKLPANSSPPTNHLSTMIREVSPELSVAAPSLQPATPETEILPIAPAKSKSPTQRP